MDRIEKDELGKLQFNRKGISAMLTVAEAAKRLHIHPNTLRRWTNTGILPVYRITSRGDRRFNETDIEHFLDETTSDYNRDMPGYLNTGVPKH